VTWNSPGSFAAFTVMTCLLNLLMRAGCSASNVKNGTTNSVGMILTYATCVQILSSCWEFCINF